MNSDVKYGIHSKELSEEEAVRLEERVKEVRDEISPLTEFSKISRILTAEDYNIRINY